MRFDRTSSRFPVAREKRPQRGRQGDILVNLRFSEAGLSPGPFPGSTSHRRPCFVMYFCVDFSPASRVANVRPLYP